MYKNVCMKEWVFLAHNFNELINKTLTYELFKKAQF